MCGYTVFIAPEQEFSRNRSRLAASTEVLQHRGPDDSGIVFLRHGRWEIGLGFKRLAILDLTSRANQPMSDPDERYWLVFNGEIYNYRELARQLEPDPVLDRSRGDTSVLLASLIRWGTEAIQRLNGMWSFVFVDSASGRLIVSRDRFGIKPLYVHGDGERLILSSEIKGVLEAADSRFPVNPDATGKYLYQGLIDDGCETFFRGIHSFPAASWRSMSLQGESIRWEEEQKYWRHPVELESPGQRPSNQKIRETFQSSVKLRLRSDVPTGILLSGGLDSSSILSAACTDENPEAITALSVVSDDPEVDESRFIDCMVKHTGCQSLKVSVQGRPTDLLEDLPSALWFNDEPILGLNVVAHRQLMQRARSNGITVLLTGQGADEQLAGYNKFFYFFLYHCLRSGRWMEASRLMYGAIRRGTVLREFRLADAKRYIPMLRRRTISALAGPRLKNVTSVDTGWSSDYRTREWLDLTRFSVPSLLHTEDRMSMSVGREMRVPYLDHRLVEQLARLPPWEKLRGGWPKSIWRELMTSDLPDAILKRTDKRGFTIPEARWMRDEFRENFRHCFEAPMRSETLGLVSSEGARSLLNRFLSGDSAIGYRNVFRVYCFEQWTRVFDDYLCPT